MGAVKQASLEAREMEAYSDKCCAIIDWAEENPEREFDTNFVEKMADLIDRGNVLTFAQREAIDNIIEKWRIQA